MRNCDRQCKTVGLTYACGERGVRDIARITHASVAANGVQAPSIQTDTM